jgi:UDP-glucuronate 4-epimerase
MKENVLVTGSAGFIGMHVVIMLLKNGFNVIGVDSLNSYYDIELKYSRLKECGIKTDKFQNCGNQSSTFSNYVFFNFDLVNRDEIEYIFNQLNIDIVIHLAAQAGVRFSITNPDTYIKNNIDAFFNVIDVSRINNVKHFIYASSSSVYGNAIEVPFKETLKVDEPVSLYAATKKSNELIAHSYSEIYNLPTTGLRFFTVYGPWGRPDMAYFDFTKSIMESKPINIFNKGILSRDFTFIDDIVDGIFKVMMGRDIQENTYEILNIGNNTPVKLIDFISQLENIIGISAIKRYVEMQKGDVNITFSDIDKISTYGYLPKTSIAEGLGFFVKWYKSYYGK